MKSKRLFITALLLLCLTVFAQAQPLFGAYKLKFISGNVKFLKGQSTLNVVFDYDGMLVGQMNENDYIVKKIDERNKAKAGDGDRWAESWKGDRTKRFHPKFMKYFESSLKKLKIKPIENANDAQYTVMIDLIRTEPGLYTGVDVVQKNTYIDAVITLYETSNPDAVLASISADYFVGDAGDFANYDIGNRIEKSYVNLGIYLGKFLCKDALKK